MCEVREVLGHDDLLKTWVCEVVFQSSLTHEQQVVMTAIMGQKPFHFGFVADARGLSVVMHSTREKVRRPQCISALRDVFKVARVEASIQKMVTMNCFHLELFGLRPNPGPTFPKKAEPMVELCEEEAIEIWGKLLHSDDEKPICLSDVDEALEEARAKKRDESLTSRRSAFPWLSAPPAAHGSRILWCTPAPPHLEVAPQRVLREWQKLEWTLLRCESAEMLESPTMDHFLDFCAVYMALSTVRDDRKLLHQAFDTFATHVHQMTGRKILKKELSEAALAAIRQRGAGKHCQSCSRALSEELIMDVNGWMVRRHSDGMFCCAECARGRCKGCSFPLDERGHCVKRCGIRWHGAVRRATWREYFQQYPSYVREAKSWCRVKLLTCSHDLLESTMDFTTYGGHHHVMPDAFF